MFRSPVQFMWLALALALLSVTAHDIRAESTIVLNNSKHNQGGAITFFVKASSKDWSKAVRIELSPGESRRLRLASDDTCNIAARNAEGVIMMVTTVKKWDAKRGFDGEFVTVGKQDVDLHKILSERVRKLSRYHLIFKGLGKGKSPSDYTPQEKAAPGGEMGVLEVTPRGGTLTFPAVFG